MAKAKKPVKVKTNKDKLEKVRKDYHDKLPDSERNPNHKEDFEKALETLFHQLNEKGNRVFIY